MIAHRVAVPCWRGSYNAASSPSNADHENRKRRKPEKEERKGGRFKNQSMGLEVRPLWEPMEALNTKVKLLSHLDE